MTLPDRRTAVPKTGLFARPSDRASEGPARPRFDLAVSNRRCRAIVKATRATAVRDLAALAHVGLVMPLGEARSASGPGPLPAGGVPGL